MKIGLASYPKSGNTWLRLMLMHLLGDNTEAWTPDQPIGHGGSYIHHDRLEDICLTDTSLLTPEESDLLRPLVQLAAPQSHPTVLCKTHDGYRLNRAGRPVLQGAGERVVYLVRDPRDVAISLAAFWNRSLAITVEFMNRKDAAVGSSSLAFNKQVHQKLFDWSGHVRSWLEQDTVPVLLIRYEDLRVDPATWLARVADFTGLTVSEADIARAVRLTTFDRLQSQENAHGFREHNRRALTPFFRRGQSGEWRQALSAELLVALETAHGTCMEALGYLCETLGAATAQSRPVPWSAGRFDQPVNDCHGDAVERCQ